MLALLWPRFELILEMNVQSVRSTDPQRLGGLDTRPHYVRAGEGNKGVLWSHSVVWPMQEEGLETGAAGAAGRLCLPGRLMAVFTPWS